MDYSNPARLIYTLDIIMDMKFVDREKVTTSRKSSSKYKALVDNLSKLEPGGRALEVPFKSEKELNSMRNVVYTFNRENDIKIKSNKDSDNNRIFFFRND
jgi:hypothetical protein